MKRILNIILISGMLVAGPATVIYTTGCQSTGQVIATSSSTVDAAMKSWAVYVVDGHASAEQETLVRKLKLEYDAAEDIALVAYREYNQTGDKTSLNRAKDALLKSREQLLQIINLLTNDKKGTR